MFLHVWDRYADRAPTQLAYAWESVCLVSYGLDRPDLSYPSLSLIRFIFDVSAFAKLSPLRTLSRTVCNYVCTLFSRVMSTLSAS